MLEDIKDICNLFYGASNLPIYIYEKNECVLALSPTSDIIPLIPINQPDSLLNPYIYTSTSFGLWGIIVLPDTDIRIVTGPAYTVPITEALVKDFLRENAIAIEQTNSVSTFLSLVPSISMSQMLNKIALLYYLLTGKKIDPLTHFNAYNEQISSERKIEEIQESTNAKERETTHNTYSWEQELYRIIRSGNSEQLNAYFEDTSAISQLVEGKVATHPIRQAKNLFIGLITKIGMLAAIPGGLDIEQTYQLIDLYERECEALNDIEAIYKLNYVAAMDFCRRMSTNAIPDGISSDVYNSMEFIKRNVNQNINIADVANSINRSSSYVISHFKSELGINVGAYIIRCKLEEAKSLLTYSSRSLSEISNYLCFASQSHFQNSFKKQYGLTPLQYRKKTLQR